MTWRGLIASVLYLVPGLLFVELARQHWAFLRRRRPRSQAFRMVPIVTTVLAAHYLLLAARGLLPWAVPDDPLTMIRTPWHVLVEDPWLLTLALLRHLLYLLPLPEKRPSRAWLVTNYGVGIGTGVVSAFLRLHPGATTADQELAHHVFELGFTVLGVLCLREFVRTARPGAWHPEYAGEMRRPDVILVQVVGALAFVAFPVVWALGGGAFAAVIWEVLVGLAVAAPMVSRMLGHVVPGLVVTGGLVAGTAAIITSYTVALSRLDASFHVLAGFVAVAATVALFAGGEGWLRTAATRVLLRRRDREVQALQRFLQTLTPDLGVVECSARVLDELVRVRRLPGAAIIFADGERLVRGEFDIDPLAQVWPRGAALDAMPRGPYGSGELRDLPLTLRDAILEADVGLGLSSIDSPRRRWGHLFMRTGLFGGSFREDDVDAFEAFLDQLALLLDAADLLARAVAVERSLAHAEKLAAIGELAARFAHDIRNPVTAARSLAQQLARDPTAPANAEHAAIILVELERVERQVRDLLRFARREEFHFASVDVGELARGTMARLRPRLDAAGVTAEVTAPPGVLARGDRDKLDQVLVNLVENAVDAMEGVTGPRRIALEVATEDGIARVRVADSGPGVAADALPRLFEPFFSGKQNGTGLGLAIAKRTIDAHGGRIDADQRPGCGLAFAIELPLAGRSG